MISTASVMKVVGEHGRLVPFFKCVGVYFLALGAEGSATPSVVAVAAKCAPVIALLLLVLLYHDNSSLHRGQYAKRISAGLALSALGDALLVWPQHLATGMAAFAMAHVAYIAAFGMKPRAMSRGALTYGATALFVYGLRPPPALRVAVPIYSALLATMAWRGVARGARRTTAGALLFLFSDAVLGYTLFSGPLPAHHVLVMVTYYLGQLCIALSALDSPSLTAPVER